MPGSTTRRIWVSGPIIVGAGPSGLAVAACLKEKGIPSLILERANCMASLWQLKTYDRLRLHLPKQFSQLPMKSFPSHFPTYPTKQQFLEYLDDYTESFDLKPVFNKRVVIKNNSLKYFFFIQLPRMVTVALLCRKKSNTYTETQSIEINT